MSIFLSCLIIFIVWCCVWGCICQMIGNNRNVNYGFLWGFFLGIIGLIIIICLGNGNNNSINAVDNVEAIKNLKELKESGAITNEEFENSKKKILEKI